MVNHNADGTGRQYWRSLDEWAQTPEFQTWMEREFPEGSTGPDGLNRRHFMKIMAASFAVAGVGVTGCRRPEQYILPYSKQPEGVIPGVPVHFATSYPGSRDSVPLVVETHQNRPTHIEGNRQFSPYGGATSAMISASVLDLYDPDRLTASYGENSRRLNRQQIWDLLDKLSAEAQEKQGSGLAVLARPSTSPTRARLRAELEARMPNMVWAEYDPVDANHAERVSERIFGQRVRTHYRLGQAKRILSIDADFMSSEPGSIENARGFASGRRVKNSEEARNMNRLYAVESPLTVTGSLADHRLRLSGSEIELFVRRLAAQILDHTTIDKGLVTELRASSSALAKHDAWINACADDLYIERGFSVVVAGSHLSEACQALVFLINQVLEAPGHTLDYLVLEGAPAASLSQLAEALEGGEVETLLILGGNPVFDAPADLEFGRLLSQAGRVIRYGYEYDETSAASQIVVAANHYMEQWSDGRSFDGTLVPVQPMILPLFEGVAELELMAHLNAQPAANPYDLVLDTFAGLTGVENAERKFQEFLSEGYLPESGFPVAEVSVSVQALRAVLSEASVPPGPNAGSLEVRLIADYSVRDGSFCNNGWMQECPDPITKLTWDNSIQVSPKLAAELGFETARKGLFNLAGTARTSSNFSRGRELSPIGRLTLDGVTIEGPVQIQPGLPDWTVILPLGYGRRQVGRVGEGAGFDAYPLLHSEHGMVRRGAKLEILPQVMELANTQEHWSMEGRAIVREADAAYHAEHPHWVDETGMESHSPPVYGKSKDMSLQQKSLETPRGMSLYETPDFGDPPPNVDVWKDAQAREKFIPEQQWGMTIDLNTCIGCNACVVACQSENNIPIVGKDQMIRGREMHWIRLDRYYSTGDLETSRTEIPTDPEVSLMPVACLHCEMAPCEQVCPVNATVHDRQGLNVMAYNRCVGTRYCANNCPYKVRRFNFFDYNKRSTEEFYAGPLGTDQYKTDGGVLKSMQRNPDVTVRMRGVMEKCTYCVQRIEQAKIAQRVKSGREEGGSNNIRVPDGVLQVACQVACPTDAIVFGDISDPESRVSKEKENDRDYSLLGYLNTRPRTTYLARLRNLNPRISGEDPQALSRKEYKVKQGNGGHAAKGAHNGNGSHGAAPDQAEDPHGGSH